MQAKVLLPRCTRPCFHIDGASDLSTAVESRWKKVPLPLSEEQVYSDELNPLDDLRYIRFIRIVLSRGLVCASVRTRLGQLH